MTVEQLHAAISTPPVEGQPWQFADDEGCREAIHKLSNQEVAALVRNGAHLHSAARIRKALGQVQSLFTRRKHALEMMVACAIARVNLVFLGPPGTAKSLMVRSFCETVGVRPDSTPIANEGPLIDAARKLGGDWTPPRRRLFEYLLTRYTTPEELFGAIDIDLMLQAGTHGRRSQGMLPQAEVAFLDEIFKANNAILNALLSITNERIFYNMGQAFRVDLAFVVGASNETPDEEELGALYDRFPIRVPCKKVDSGELESVIEKSHRFANLSLPARIACLNDIRLLSRVVMSGIYGGESVFPANTDFRKHFMEMLLTLREGYSISDRTPAQLVRISRALGMLETGGPVDALGASHLRSFGYLAQRMENAFELQRLVHSRIGRLDSSAVDLFDEV